VFADFDQCLNDRRMLSTFRNQIRWVCAPCKEAIILRVCAARQRHPPDLL